MRIGYGDPSIQSGIGRGIGDSGRAKDAKAAQAAVAYRGDSSRVSAEAKASSMSARSFDLEKVDSLRSDLSSGRLQANSGVIASRILEEG
jgi:anti-sigma28 factor (negative regulator of flagellin synthesis)